MKIKFLGLMLILVLLVGCGEVILDALTGDFKDDQGNVKEGYSWLEIVLGSAVGTGLLIVDKKTPIKPFVSTIKWIGKFFKGKGEVKPTE